MSLTPCLSINTAFTQSSRISLFMSIFKVKTLNIVKSVLDHPNSSCSAISPGRELLALVACGTRGNPNSTTETV